MRSDASPDDAPSEAALERELAELAAKQDALLAVEHHGDQDWEAEFRFRADVPGGPQDGIALLGATGPTKHEALRQLLLLARPRS